MVDFDRISMVKAAAELRLLQIPGVHAVGIGLKETGGIRTTELCIHVFLVQKKPANQVPAEHLIPPEIDGVKTDVIEMAVPQRYAEDTSSARPLEGGVMLQVVGGDGYFGTLGCIAQTNDATPIIVALTCQHVVGVLTGTDTSLLTVTPTAVVTGTKVNFTFEGANTAGSVVLVEFGDPSATPPQPSAVIYYQTTPSDSLASIAAAVAAAINKNAIPGVTAALGATTGEVVVDLGSTPLAAGNTQVYDPPSNDSSLTASVAGNVITVNGTSASACGVYAGWDVNGPSPTGGVFVATAGGDNASKVASKIADGINAYVKALSISGIQASACSSCLPCCTTVTIKGANQVMCLIQSSVLVGQPTSDDTAVIGEVVAAHLDLDVAVIRLNANLTYLAEVKGIGPIAAPPYTVKASDLPYSVTTRGTASAQVTTGQVTSLGVTGVTSRNPNGSSLVANIFSRYYTGAMRVTPTGTTQTFGKGGDSGSAVLNSSNQVVGILFGGSGNSATPSSNMITPIAPILAGLNLTPATATASGVVQTVPASQGVATDAASAELADNPSTASSVPPTVPRAESLSLLQRAQADLESTSTGQTYARLVRQHTGETLDLLNNNRRVATAWHRNGGPQLIRDLMRMLQGGDRRIPLELNGEPLAECLKRILSAFALHGSSALAQDLKEYGPPLAEWGGLTYSQLLSRLQSPALEH